MIVATRFRSHVGQWRLTVRHTLELSSRCRRIDLILWLTLLAATPAPSIAGDLELVTKAMERQMAGLESFKFTFEESSNSKSSKKTIQMSPMGSEIASDDLCTVAQKSGDEWSLNFRDGKPYHLSRSMPERGDLGSGDIRNGLGVQIVNFEGGSALGLLTSARKKAVTRSADNKAIIVRIVDDLRKGFEHVLMFEASAPHRLLTVGVESGRFHSEFRNLGFALSDGVWHPTEAVYVLIKPIEPDSKGERAADGGVVITKFRTISFSLHPAIDFEKLPKLKDDPDITYSDRRTGRIRSSRAELKSDNDARLSGKSAAIEEGKKMLADLALAERTLKRTHAVGEWRLETKFAIFAASIAVGSFVLAFVIHYRRQLRTG